MADKPLWVFPNLEMGDNVVCNGMARALARCEENVFWIARARYFDDIKKMFSDMPNVTVVDGYDYPEARINFLREDIRATRLGYFSSEAVYWRAVQWDQKFYEQAGVPFEERWKSFSLPSELLPKTVSYTEIALIHEVPERGFLIDQAKLPKTLNFTRITKRPSFWDWLPDILSAAELHFVDSSYLNLAESLYAMGFLRNTKLVFHYYIKFKLHGSVPPVLRAPWQILWN